MLSSSTRAGLPDAFRLVRLAAACALQRGLSWALPTSAAIAGEGDRARLLHLHPARQQEHAQSAEQASRKAAPNRRRAPACQQRVPGAAAPLRSVRGHRAQCECSRSCINPFASSSHLALQAAAVHERAPARAGQAGGCRRGQHDGRPPGHRLRGRRGALCGRAQHRRGHDRRCARGAAHWQGRPSAFRPLPHPSQRLAAWKPQRVGVNFISWLIGKISRRRRAWRRHMSHARGDLVGHVIDRG